MSPAYLRTHASSHCAQIGEELVSDQEKAKDPVEFVKKLLEMRDKYDVIVSEAFRGEKKAQKKLKDAFEEFINADTRCASYLVLYIDELLRSALKGMNEEEADAQLEKVIVIFRYLQDKDVFESFYKRYLAKRLLAGKSMSEDSERSMIAKLKTECGYHFTSKLEGMFTDMSMSKETMEQFTESLLAQDEGGGNGGGGGGNDEDVVLLKVEGGPQSAGGGGSSSLASGEGQTSSSSSSSSSLPPVELDVKVLTAAHWPASVTAQCTLPPELTPCYDSFQAFYLRKHTGRKLAWQTSLGNADLKARFGKNRHELNVSTYQMCILMRFNGPGNETQTLEVLSELGIPRDELKRHLVSLCTPKHRILKKVSKGKGIEDGDSFTFNAEYTSKLKRVKIPLVSAKETSKF
jgi:cullin 3